MKKTGEENWIRESIEEKPPKLNEEMWKENRKIMDIINEKTFQSEQRQGRKNRRWCGERRELAKNEVLFSSQQGRIANGSIHQMQALRHLLRQRVRFLTTCRLLALLKIKLILILFLSSYSHLTCFVVHLFAGRACFRLRGSVGLAVSLAIKWPATLPSSATGPSCRRSNYHRSGHWRSSYYGSRPSKSDYCKLSYCRSTHCGSTYCGLSYQKCNINKRQGRYGLLASDHPSSQL